MIQVIILQAISYVSVITIGYIDFHLEEKLSSQGAFFIPLYFYTRNSATSKMQCSLFALFTAIIWSLTYFLNIGSYSQTSMVESLVLRTLSVLMFVYFLYSFKIKALTNQV